MLGKIKYKVIFRPPLTSFFKQSNIDIFPHTCKTRISVFRTVEFSGSIGINYQSSEKTYAEENVRSIFERMIELELSAMCIREVYPSGVIGFAKENPRFAYELNWLL